MLFYCSEMYRTAREDVRLLSFHLHPHRVTGSPRYGQKSVRFYTLVTFTQLLSPPDSGFLIGINILIVSHWFQDNLSCTFVTLVSYSIVSYQGGMGYMAHRNFKGNPWHSLETLSQTQKCPVRTHRKLCETYYQGFYS